MSDFWDDEQASEYDHYQDTWDAVQEISTVAPSKAQKKQQKKLENKKAQHVEQQQQVESVSVTKKQSGKYEEADEEGFTKLKTQPQQQQKQTKQQVVPQHDDDDDQPEKKKKKKKAKNEKEDNRKKIVNVLENIDDPYDYLANLNRKESQKEAVKQRAVSKKQAKQQKQQTAKASDAVSKSKAEKQGKLSSITKLQFTSPQTSTKKSGQSSDKKKKHEDVSATSTSTTASTTTTTTPSASTSITLKQFNDAVKEATTKFKTDPVSQLKFLAGWFEQELFYVSSGETINLNEDVTTTFDKWARSFKPNALTEAYKFVLETVYDNRGIAHQNKKFTGLKLFGRLVRQVKPKAAAEALGSSGNQFQLTGVSYRNFKSELEPILIRSRASGVKAAISFTLHHLLSDNKLKQNEVKDAIQYLTSLLNGEDAEEEDLKQNHHHQFVLVDPSQFVALQKQIGTSTDLEQLYQDLLAASVHNNLSVYFEPMLLSLKSKLSPDVQEEVCSLLLKGIKRDEKCVDIWVKNMSKQVQSTCILLEYINQNGGLQGVKRSGEITRELQRIVASSKKDDTLVQRLKEQTETFEKTNAGGSILSFLIQFLLLVVLLVGGIYGFVTYSCSSSAAAESSADSDLCKQAKWITSLLSNLMKKRSL
jgi:hypothetical protein